MVRVGDRNVRRGDLGFLSSVPEWLFICGEENGFSEDGLGAGL